MDRKKVIKELHDARRYLEDKEWSDRGASPHIDAINDALALLKEDCHNCKLECLLQRYDQLKEKYEKLLNEQETPNGKCVNECECWDSAYERGKQDVLKGQEAKWVEDKQDEHCRLIKCSNCGLTFIVGNNIPYDKWIEDRNYCLRCGARMKGDRRNEQ